MALLNLVRVSTATTGTGTLTLGGAVSGFLSMSGAGAVDGQSYDYAIEDGSPVTQREIGAGVWNAGTQTLARTTVRDSTNGGSPIDVVGPAQVIITPNRHTWREFLETNRTYYVRTDGDDGNTGLANNASGAWATLTHAWKTICSTLDLAGHAVTLQLNAGTFEGGFSTYGDVTGVDSAFTSAYVPVGGGSVVIKGIPGSTRIEGAAISDDASFEVAHTTETAFDFQDVIIAGDGAGAGSIYVYVYAAIYLERVSFADLSGLFGVWCFGPASIFITGASSFTGNAEGYLYVHAGANVSTGLQTITIVGTPTWGTAFVDVAENAYLRPAATFSGSATGKRYAASLNGVINTFGAGASYLPGDVAGTTATGGQYA